MHQWDGQTPLEETLGALHTLVEQGKVRYVGVSNYSGWHLLKALGVSERLRLPRFAAEQIYYSLQARDAENELLPAASDQGLGVLVWSPLAGGLLSGKYSRGRDGAVKGPKGSRQLTDWSEPPIDFPDRLFDTIAVLNRIAAAHKVSGAQVALAWLLTRPDGHLADRRGAHHRAAAGQPGAVELTLTQDELTRSRRSAGRRCSTPTGTSATPPTSGSRPRTGCCSTRTSRGSRAVPGTVGAGWIAAVVAARRRRRQRRRTTRSSWSSATPSRTGTTTAPATSRRCCATPAGSADEVGLDDDTAALVALAACAHDVVYDGRPGADERASAEWARSG